LALTLSKIARQKRVTSFPPGLRPTISGSNFARALGAAGLCFSPERGLVALPDASKHKRLEINQNKKDRVRFFLNASNHSWKARRLLGKAARVE
jgi:hypothetical protein